MQQQETILTNILCSISTFSIFPETKYSQYYSKNTASLITAAWEKTGDNLWNAISKGVGVDGKKTF